MLFFRLFKRVVRTVRWVPWYYHRLQNLPDNTKCFIITTALEGFRRSSVLQRTPGVPLLLIFYNVGKYRIQYCILSVFNDGWYHFNRLTTLDGKKNICDMVILIFLLWLIKETLICLNVLLTIHLIFSIDSAVSYYLSL